MQNRLLKKKQKYLKLAYKILNNETPIKYDPETAIKGDFLSLIHHIAMNGHKFQQILRVFYRGKKLQDELDDLYENHTYYSDYQRMYSANVKIYEFVDIDDTFDKMWVGEYTGRNYKRNPLSENQREWIKEHFTDEYLSDLWWMWIEHEREWMIENIKEDFPEVDLDDAGFYGRSGGHFCLCKPVEAEYEYCDHEDFVDEFFEDGDFIDEDGIPMEDEYEWWSKNNGQMQDDLFKTVKDIRGALDLAKKFSKAITFHDEIAYRIDEYVDTNLAEYKDWLAERKEECLQC